MRPPTDATAPDDPVTAATPERFAGQYSPMAARTILRTSAPSGGADHLRPLAQEGDVSRSRLAQPTAQLGTRNDQPGEGDCDRREQLNKRVGETVDDGALSG